MRIGVTCYPTYGGSGVVATELGLEMAARGHEVHFVSYALPVRLHRHEANVFFHEVEVMAYPLFEHPPYALSLATRMADLAERAHLDLLHVHYAIPHAVSAYLARQILGPTHPLKILTTLHGTDITLVGTDPSFFPLTRFVLEESDGVTCVSRYLEDKTREIFHLSRPLVTIPNFVDTRRFRPREDREARRRFAPRGEKILTHLSNFRPLKRITDIIRIFAAVREQIPTVLLLMGEGVERPRAAQLARELGVEKEVLFLGKQENVEEILGLADLFLLPSEQEAFGLAALEAMSCGVPVIATNVGGLPEVVPHGAGGLLYPVGEVAAMAAGAIELLTDESRLARFREGARAWACARFDSRQIVPLYEEYYRKIVAAPSP